MVLSLSRRRIPIAVISCCRCSIYGATSLPCQASGRTARAQRTSPLCLPAGAEICRPTLNAPTPHVWIIGRTQTNGVKDYDAVHKVQDGYKITLLDDWGKTPRKIEQKI